MTLSAEHPAWDQPYMSFHATRDVALPLWKVIAISLLAVCAISLPNLVDPFIRHDDYPAFLSEASWYWRKTLHEGRWINYIWHLRGIVTPSWLNFAIYQALWATLSAALAVAAMGRDGHRWFTIVLALFILASSPAVLIALWFNTLLPGLAIVTLYALLGCWVSQRTLRALLPVFVIISFSTYTTSPLILLAVCLMRTQHRSWRDLFGLITLFVLSFAAAVLLTYTLNWQIHGVFGVPLDSWRNATPASDLAGMVANLSVLGTTFKTLMVLGSYNFVPAAYFHIGLLLVASLVMFSRAPKEALYLHAGLWAGLALIVLQVLKLGVVVPPRAFIFAWVFYAVIVVRAAALLSTTPGLAGRLMRNASLLVVLSYLLATFYQYSIYRQWQAETRALGTALNNIDPDITRPVLVYGDVLTLDSAKAAYLQKDMALAFRIQQLTGHKVILCHSAPDSCTEVEESRREKGLPKALKVEIETSDSEIRLKAPME
jgi:MFS family permease